MASGRWTPPIEPSAGEARILKRVAKKRKLFGFLRAHRHELFSDDFQDELETMYRKTGAGKPRIPPAKLAMAVLLQAYSDASDSEAVELAACDARWQACLDCLGEEPPFSQGALFDFRQRLIEHGLDKRLLERTVELARESGIFDWKQVPKELRVVVDSSPLRGAGRVEDTITLLAHAARKIVAVVADRAGLPHELVVDEMGIPLLAAPSIKSGLDVDWTVPGAGEDALNRLLKQIDAMERWVKRTLADESRFPPLRDHLDLLEKLREQDLEPDPDTPGRFRIRQGTARDRRISIEDGEMRHGRKSSTKAFNGYKRHFAAEPRTGLVLAAELLPANLKEAVALSPLHDAIVEQGLSIGAYDFDRGYVASELVPELLRDGIEIVSKPWTSTNRGRFTKRDFRFNLRNKTVTCPAGESQPYEEGGHVEFDAPTCSSCELRPRCTDRPSGRGRSMQIHPQEELQERFRRMAATKKGRARQRERVPVEHRLAHLSQRQGDRARYLGCRKNLFDVRRHAAVMNLEAIQRIGEARTESLATAA